MPVTDDARIDTLWVEYKQTGSSRSRNQLIEHYLPLVNDAAERLRAKLPNVVQLDDLVGAGVLGLMDAIAGFEPGRGVKFATFSAMRIRGAILDEIRALDWVPRLVRSRCRQLDTASKELEAELGRPPKDDELAARLNLSRSAIHRGDYKAVGMMSLSGGPRNEGEGEGEGAGPDQSPMALADERTPDPAREAQRRFLKQMLTRGLSRAERLVVKLYYYEEMTMKEIGQTLDLSESRVSQMHTEILRRLRELTDGVGERGYRELREAAAAA